MDSEAEAPAVFEVRAISKVFGGIVALDEANLRLDGGEIHALIGENGAGKSTLINIATGVYPPDGGQVILDEAPLELSGPRSAAPNGRARSRFRCSRPRASARCWTRSIWTRSRNEMPPGWP